MRSLIVLLMLLILNQAEAIATDSPNWSEMKIIEDQSEVSKNQVDRHDFSLMKKKSLIDSQHHLDFINDLVHKKNAITASKRIQFAKDAVVFVSFSMPDSLLVALSEQAHAFHIPVVLRGLVENDFKKTLQRLELVKGYADKNHKTFYGLSIDPLWFEQFDIQSVPALVVIERPMDCENQQRCANQRFDVVYGNASIKEGLAIIKEKSTRFAEVAANLLRGKHHD